MPLIVLLQPTLRRQLQPQLTMTLSSQHYLLVLLLFVWKTTVDAFVVVPARTRIVVNQRSSSSVITLGAKEGPSKEQQEKLDKWGPTPETSFEMLFDKLEGASEHDPRMKAFLSQPGGDEWKELIENMKDVKKEKNSSAKEVCDDKGTP